ncbi:MAG: hypothetical protein A3D24_01515 [Candidatus Blackburnbacteria bacterium RIFCSPHIGHO2_02_FULL_39_13]|uniref:histidine kinase n=1 Tax=Candidatus Blackburnbacteria bacterium RIFCSPLOWO2_01_FULL_40_20 TaxID=1797519 RepID=A0A1G1VD99_9BACT|nr:MAG: hypothetical protein A2694_02590 [Candidatus Blackburnbacteria bacterium RIFCSPHIGHO2_01_FULL_40_17]OGY08722.1 MAG: hypothetical protein A3D24_01515 [Candidatus Blackburnbacteria bacterium RIFCSPHIGHO2_02_FULL_39_13]OGY13236.1 MAG: hypothetical protein A3A77_01540 [Candidatus Blackburnbacteria bacterium RIFCSPLOWO2_01_FULL_40_20]
MDQPTNQAPTKANQSTQVALDQNQTPAPVDFVSMVAHELKTPLTSLRGYLSVFIEENAKSMTPEQNMFLSRMDIASTQLSTLVENLLNTSRIERGVITLNPEVVEWVPFVKTIFVEFENRAKERKIELEFIEPTTGFTKLMVDKLRITEVISNLITNAITYNKEGGKIILSIEVKDNEVVTHVQDTGIGIAKEAQGKLFEKYYRVQNSAAGRANGTGLGLYVSKVFVQMHKGKIWVNSESDKGSTFSFSLPVARDVPSVQK